MKKTMCIVLAFTMFYVGCAGREANPVVVYQPGDEKKNCQFLTAELEQIQVDIKRRKKQEDETLVWNSLCLAGGFFILVPWFFMDLKGAAATEGRALEDRYNRLSLIAGEKGCEVSSNNVNEHVVSWNK